jgi:hypothetical protein
LVLSIVVRFSFRTAHKMEQNEKKPLRSLEPGCMMPPPLFAPFLPFDLPVCELGRVWFLKKNNLKLFCLFLYVPDQLTIRFSVFVLISLANVINAFSIFVLSLALVSINFMPYSMAN